MSAQTGEEVPEGPASSRAVDRAKFRVEVLRRDPNPIWVRELKQSARLVRTPFILMALCVLMTLVIAALGATMDEDGATEKIGTALYHVYFSLAFFVVTFAGPAIAANSIASEREGRTWEAVMLTGLAPELIARGKFLAALTSIATYLAMLAPVGALAFLFGGVSALEVVLAFVFLFGIGTLFVLLGLAISSQTQSMRASLIATLFVSVPFATFLFGAFGLIGSGFAHALWPKIPSGMPVWFPTAYLRADFGAEYLLLLVAGPLVFLGLPAWFLYQTVVANLKDANDDQSKGHKRWFLVATPVIAIYSSAVLFTVDPRNALGVGVACLLWMFAHLAFSILVFASEPIGPSRRVRAAWDREKAGAVRRFFGPSVASAALLQLAVGTISVALLTAVTLVRSGQLDKYGRAVEPEALRALLVFIVYIAAFYVFSLGVTTWLRARLSPLVTRVLTIAIVAGLSVAPWVVAVVAQAILKSGSNSYIFAAPSPFYSFVMASNASRRVMEGSELVAGYVVIAIWLVVGVVLMRLGAARAAQQSAAIDAQVAETDARLAAEDLARVELPPSPFAEPAAEPEKVTAEDTAATGGEGEPATTGTGE
ncbi:MAG: ABC transporter permease [Polyangiaceae bacterium]